MDAFLDFYEKNSARLTGKIKSYNESLMKDSNPLLVPVKEDLADLNAGGKLLRGVITCLGYRITGKNACAFADGAAIAFEIFQSGVLVHDDIIDHADTRRGKETIPVRMRESFDKRGIKPLTGADSLLHISDSAAICAGDLLLFESNMYLAKTYAANKNLGAFIQEFDGIILNTIRGELLDVILPYELEERSRTDKGSSDLLNKSVIDIYHLKTSCYSVVGPLHMGMLLGGAKKPQMADVDSFADDLGIAFQIKDDLLGIYGDETKLGKSVGSDISEYKQTILYAWLKGHAPSYFEKLLELYGKPDISVEELEKVRTIFTDSGAYAYASSKMTACFESARRKLDKLTFLRKSDRKILEYLISYMETRKK